METLVFFIVVGGIMFLSNRYGKIRDRKEALASFKSKFEKDYLPKLRNRINSEINDFSNLNKNYTPHTRDQNLHSNYQTSFERLTNRSSIPYNKILINDVENIKNQLSNALDKSLEIHLNTIKKGLT